MSLHVMVDMSATILHHGHIRLIQESTRHGVVTIGLTTDEEILASKGYVPELDFSSRKEILESIKGVDKVVPTPWLITDEVLDEFNIDLLVHGDDNSNHVRKERLLVLPRTKNVSSTEMRQRAMRSITQIRNNRLMLTPGPAVVLHENLQGLQPVFGRGDKIFKKIRLETENWIKQLSGQDELVTLQGSATLALEVAAKAFVSGKVLLIETGYYSARLAKLLPRGCDLTRVSYKALNKTCGKFDWVLCAYTETSHAFKVDLEEIRDYADRLDAKLYVDATGSIGLEDRHDLSDVCAFSSCKGLFGLTGAGFIAYKKHLLINSSSSYYLDLETHRQRNVTGPYHAISSLYNIIPIHENLKWRVKLSKEVTLKEFSGYTENNKYQPLLCTYLNGRVERKSENVVLYQPRSNQPGSVVCHLGEIHKSEVNLHKSIKLVSIDEEIHNINSCAVS